MCVCCAGILLGFAALLDRSGSNDATMLGGILITVGVCGIAYQALLIYREFVQQQLHAERVARRAIIRGERRKRTETQRQKDSSERARAAAAEVHRKEYRANERQAKNDTDLEESRSKAVRDAEIQALVLQYRSQPLSELAISASTAFSNIGWLVSVPNSEAPFDLILVKLRSNQDPLRCVARCVPPERTAGLADLRELDAWREHETAEHGYLISVTGFDEQAVRQLRFRPGKITLVEAHILALWSSKCIQL